MLANPETTTDLRDEPPPSFSRGCAQACPVVALLCGSGHEPRQHWRRIVVASHHEKPLLDGETRLSSVAIRSSTARSHGDCLHAKGRRARWPYRPSGFRSFARARPVAGRFEEVVSIKCASVRLRPLANPVPHSCGAGAAAGPCEPDPATKRNVVCRAGSTLGARVDVGGAAAQVILLADAGWGLGDLILFGRCAASRRGIA